MRSALWRHVNPATAIALAALMIALGGTGYAASTISNGSVTTAKLANGSVTAPKLASGSVTTAKLANGSVTKAKLAKQSVTGDKVASGTLTAANFAPNVLGGLSSSKVTVVAGTPVNAPAGSAGTTAIATCPAGQRAISGGFIVGNFAAVDATGPTADGAGWSVTASTFDTPASISATVVCVAP